MFRSVITLALSVLLLAEASAQTAPAAAKKEAKAAKKATKATARATRKSTKQAQRAASQVPPVAVTDDGWPPLPAADTVVASATPAPDETATTAVHNRAEDIVYVAPGMAVKVRTSKEMVPYSVRPPRKRSATTLGR
jgi:sRNA-binding protein